MTKVDADTIVVGVDASECSDAALDWAAGEARRSGRRLLVVTAWHWSSSVMRSSMSLLGHDDPYTAGRHVLEQSARRARAAGVPVLTWLVEGSPAHALAEISSGAAMLVVGSHGRSPVRRSLLGSVSKGSLSQARCPVVIIPSGAAADMAGTAAAGPAAHHS
ncbi:MAG TPA: universal stress protein [Acidimicrobiales bacterium]|nr:universal stress protein [Acidimicrobiales bacterium]